jgi:hypothetical protein
MNYPDRKFEDEKVFLLRRWIKGCILDLVKGTKGPIFQSTSYREGAVIFNYADEETVKWLKSLRQSCVSKRGYSYVCWESMSCLNTIKL